MFDQPWGTILAISATAATTFSTASSAVCRVWATLIALKSQEKKYSWEKKKISSLFKHLTVRQFIDFLKRMKGLLSKDTVVTCRQESETPFVLRSDEGLTLATSAFFFYFF